MMESGFYVLSGAMFYAGTHHLYLGSTRVSTRPHLPLAAMYLLLAGFVLTSALSEQSPQINTQLQLAGIAMPLSILLWIVLIWFVAVYTEYKPLLLPDLLTAAWVVFLIEKLSWHHSLLSDGVAPTAYPNVANWWMAVEFTILASLLFCFYAAVRGFRHGHRQTAMVLMCGLAVLLLSALADLVLSTSVRSSPSLTPFGFIGFLLAHSLYYVFLDFGRRPARLPAPISYRLSFDSDLKPFNNTLTDLQPISPPRAEPEITAPPPQHSAAATDQTRSAFSAVTPDDEDSVHHQPGQSLSVEPTTAAETKSGRMDGIDRPGVKHPWQNHPGSRLQPQQTSLNTVSDNLIDIAVWATMALNRLKRDDADPRALERLCRQIRGKAIKTRRMANKLSRPD